MSTKPSHLMLLINEKKITLSFCPKKLNYGYIIIQSKLYVPYTLIWWNEQMLQWQNRNK